jgi:Transglutaminase-like superfamily
LKSGHSRRSFVRYSLISTVATSPLGMCITAHSNPTDVADVLLRRRLRFSLSFHNPSSTNLGRQVFLCYLPFNSESQMLIDFRVSVPYRLHTDKLGQNILEIDFIDVHSHFQKVVILETFVDFSKSAEGKVDVLGSTWVQSERFIEVDNPKIVSQARALKSTSDEKTIENIYEWVSNNIMYAGYISDDRGALYALENKSGDCTEYAYLVVALARVNLIPSRVIGGYMTLNNVAPMPRDYHNWAEVHLSGDWRIVDSQKQNIFPNLGLYTGFEIYRYPTVNGMEGAHRYRLDGTLLVKM